MERLSCAIAGHKPQRFKFKYNEQATLCIAIKTAISEQIKALHSNGVEIFYVGCAAGVETWAAEAALELRRHEDCSGIELFCAIPFPEHAGRFTDRQKERYQSILSQCNHKETICRRYLPDAYKRASYYMVDRAQYLIAVYDQDKSERGGLGQMVNYAIKKNLSITYIHPDTAEIHHHSQ
jgi:uncharacterized phage-like protein YoqJ